MLREGGQRERDKYHVLDLKCDTDELICEILTDIENRLVVAKGEVRGGEGGNAVGEGGIQSSGLADANYLYVCVCVCVYIYIYIWMDKQQGPFYSTGNYI